MAKSKIIKQAPEADEFDFHEMADLMDSPCEHEDMTETMGYLIEASNHQMQIAFDLTKLILEKKGTENVPEEKILQTFKRSLDFVSENYAFEKLLEQ